MIVFDDRMDYPVFVEVCGNCGTLITWNKDGTASCTCGDTDLQFILREKAVELGILKGV